ncbi:hypothetical protein LTS08_003776 [Lithohypha guttulata]|nr:hypothetical protein LTS08_003776 [Lithohypha guttulata]
MSYGAQPLSYDTPAFPSLYWPFDTNPATPKYLYSLTDIWRFTLYWTLLTVPTAHILVAGWAVIMQFSTAYQRHRFLHHAPEGVALSKKNKKLLGTLALLSGSVVGLILGAIYNAGYFRMSTWTPLFWGMVNMLVLILGGFRVQGGL